MKEKKILLTGDRPTGKLHLGHYVGSLKNRVELQNSGKYIPYIFIADIQALTDNATNPEKIKRNIIELALDYLSIGIDPNKSTMFIQSQIPELAELTVYFMNLVTLARLQRNPTVKSEIKQKGFEKSLPVGFMLYPISQAADILGFDGEVIPVGDDQLPMIEQCREISKTFNSLYGKTFVEPNAYLPSSKNEKRLPGLDGNAKMSKSLGNCIYLSDSEKEIERKIMSMYTDPNHIKVEDPGNTKNNPVFIYLDIFANDEHFKKYLPEYKNLNELKIHYEKGGLGDMKVKRLLNKIIQELLLPIREKREYYENNISYVYKMLEEGSKKARIKAQEVLKRARKAIGIEYFEDKELINKKYQKVDENMDIVSNN